ncbi:MAG: hypothetical protein WC378_16615 [Opitutaceae bacterium]
MAAPLPFKLTNLVSGIIIADDEAACPLCHFYTLTTAATTFFAVATIFAFLFFIPINFWVGEKAKKRFFAHCYRLAVGWLMPVLSIST